MSLITYHSAVYTNYIAALELNYYDRVISYQAGPYKTQTRDEMLMTSSPGSNNRMIEILRFKGDSTPVGLRSAFAENENKIDQQSQMVT